MSNRAQILATLIVDFLAINLAWYVYYMLRVQSGLVIAPIQPDFWLPMVVVYLFWLLLFFVVGLYRPWYAASRLDELALLFKTTAIGCLILFFVIFVDDEGTNTGTSTRLLIAMYWGVILAAVGIGRLALRSVQRRMLMAGIGAHETLIVGSPARSCQLFDEVTKYPALGYRVKGFAGLEANTRGGRYKGVEVLGSIQDLPGLIDRYSIREVLVALDSSDHGKLLEIVAHCNGHKVGLKIMPDLYDIISGQAKTNQIYGFPLIAISTQLMQPWEEATKRALDILVSSVVILAGMPIWILIALLIKLDSSGPVLYKQDRVGKDGKIFRIIKFRSMRQDAEKMGPQWAGKKDPRVTRVGFLLRRLHLDEVPQMLNILDGDMSLVGPRPERPMFVEKLSHEVRLYQRRLKVRPGITGWAQVKQEYDSTIDDVKKKVEYDLYYIENMSLRMDFKIILSTFRHMLLGKGR